jgi:hypothetical protein
MAFNPGTSPFRLRISVTTLPGDAGTFNYQLRVSKNGGAFTPVTATSTDGVKSTDAGTSPDNTIVRVPRLTAPVF